MNSQGESEPELESFLQEQADKGDSDLPVKPWDPKHIRITTKTFTIREIYNQITEGELDLAPDFQRSFVWKERQQIRLIESVLLGIPLPAFYFNQDSNGSHQVIDGVQRLTTVKMFMSDQLSLESPHLEYLSALGNSTFLTLDAAVRRRFAGTQIVAHVIEPQTPDDVKYDIFNRVNTGGSPLTAQEIRHCMSKQRSRTFLSSLVELPSFDEATCRIFWAEDVHGSLVRDNQRMSNREMALRFCAFTDVAFEQYARSSSLDSFLLDYTRRIDDPSTPAQMSLDLGQLKQRFDRAMINATVALGNGAFRRWPLNALRRGPINRAIFESQSVALAQYDTQVIEQHKVSVAIALRKLFDDSVYDSAVRSGTGDVRKVEYRLLRPKQVLAKVIGQ